MHKDSPLILDSYTRTEIQDYVKRQQKMREWRHFMAANHIVVTADSINMLSEACGTRGGAAARRRSGGSGCRRR